MDKEEIKKFAVTPAMLSQFFEGNRKEIASVNFLQLRKFNTETKQWEIGKIVCEVGIYTKDGKVEKTRVSNQVFIKPEVERTHFTGLIIANNKNSGKKRFYQFEGRGDETSFVIRTMVVHFHGKAVIRKYKIYVGQKPDKNVAEHELLEATLSTEPIGKFTHNGCNYWKYVSRDENRNIILEVYCSLTNPRLPRFYRFGETGDFTYV